MEDTSHGLDIIYEKLSSLGKKAHEKYGCNIFAVIATDKQAHKRPSRRGMIYESPGADGFFESRIKGAEDLLIKELLGFVPFHRSHSNPGNTQSSEGQRGRSGFNPSKSKYMDPSNNTRIYHGGLAKRALIDNAAKSGLRFDKNKFPWTSLPAYCANAGMYIDNYPHGVLSPFGEEGRSMVKSVFDLLKSERQAIINALTTKTLHPMSFVKAQDSDDIKNSRFPVLIHAPPPPGSSQKRSKRYFLDGSFDFEGHMQASVSKKSKQRVDDYDDKSDQGKNKKSNKISHLDDTADCNSIASYDEREQELIIRRLKNTPNSRKRKVDWSMPGLSTPSESANSEEKKHLEKKERLERRERGEEKKRVKTFNKETSSRY